MKNCQYYRWCVTKYWTVRASRKLPLMGELVCIGQQCLTSAPQECASDVRSASNAPISWSRPSRRSNTRPRPGRSAAVSSAPASSRRPNGSVSASASASSSSFVPECATFMPPPDFAYPSFVLLSGPWWSFLNNKKHCIICVCGCVFFAHVCVSDGLQLSTLTSLNFFCWPRPSTFDGKPNLHVLHVPPVSFLLLLPSNAPSHRHALCFFYVPPPFYHAHSPALAPSFSVFSRQLAIDDVFSSCRSATIGGDRGGPPSANASDGRLCILLYIAVDTPSPPSPNFFFLLFSATPPAPPLSSSPTRLCLLPGGVALVLYLPTNCSPLAWFFFFCPQQLNQHVFHIFFLMISPVPAEKPTVFWRREKETSNKHVAFSARQTKQTGILLVLNWPYEKQKSEWINSNTRKKLHIEKNNHFYPLELQISLVKWRNWNLKMKNSINLLMDLQTNMDFR